MNVFSYLKSFNIIGIILWVLFAVVGFYLIKTISRLFKYLLPSDSPLNVPIESNEKEIASHANDLLSNGYTYTTASQYLFENMYGNNPLGWWKTTDHASVGNFILKVKPEEYKLLSNLYKQYKDVKGTWIIGSKLVSLSDDLRDLFSSSEEDKYLSHLKHVL